MRVAAAKSADLALTWRVFACKRLPAKVSANIAVACRVRPVARRIRRKPMGRDVAGCVASAERRGHAPVQDHCRPQSPGRCLRAGELTPRPEDVLATADLALRALRRPAASRSNPRARIPARPTLGGGAEHPAAAGALPKAAPPRPPMPPGRLGAALDAPSQQQTQPSPLMQPPLPLQPLLPSQPEPVPTPACGGVPTPAAAPATADGSMAPRSSRAGEQPPRIAITANWR